MPSRPYSFKRNVTTTNLGVQQISVQIPATFKFHLYNWQWKFAVATSITGFTLNNSTTLLDASAATPLLSTEVQLFNSTNIVPPFFVIPLDVDSNQTIQVNIVDTGGGGLVEVLFTGVMDFPQ